MYGEGLQVERFAAIVVDSSAGLWQMSIVMEAPEGAIESSSLLLIQISIHSSIGIETAQTWGRLWHSL